ncbi:hypothetical protein LCGC14_2691160 [marine sediment metagenome]|uniref:Uncharacterized protein n=1 Tax=marine sediment metagenome TaxID=412755 RepID=A0A0F9A5Y5_9ZZZZ
MRHTHHYSYWHAHDHVHSKFIEEHWLPGPTKICVESKLIVTKHDTGHYHNWMQTHDHGGGADKAPHTHKAKQDHTKDDKVTKHHHALDAHDTEKE